MFLEILNQSREISYNKENFGSNTKLQKSFQKEVVIPDSIPVSGIKVKKDLPPIKMEALSINKHKSK